MLVSSQDFCEEPFLNDWFWFVVLLILQPYTCYPHFDLWISTLCATNNAIHIYYIHQWKKHQFAQHRVVSWVQLKASVRRGAQRTKGVLFPLALGGWHWGGGPLRFPWWHEEYGVFVFWPQIRTSKGVPLTPPNQVFGGFLVRDQSRWFQPPLYFCFLCVCVNTYVVYILYTIYCILYIHIYVWWNSIHSHGMIIPPSFDEIFGSLQRIGQFPHAFDRNVLSCYR